MTAEDELKSRQAAEDARPTADATYTSGLIRNIARGMTAADAEAIAREQLRRRQDAWGQAISDSMAQLGDEAFTVPGISGYVYQQPSVEQLIVNEMKALAEHPDDAELRATARRIVVIVRHHNP